LPVLVIAPRAFLVPLECSEGIRPTKAISRGAVAKRRGFAELGGDGQGGQIVDAAETAKALDAWPQRLEIKERPQVLLDGLEPRDRFIDGAEVGPMRLIKRRQRPRLGAQPGIVPFRPCLLRGGEAAPVAEQEFRESMAGAQQIGANVFATPQKIAGGFFLLGGNVNRGQRAGAEEDRQVSGIPAIRLDAVARPTRNECGGATRAGLVAAPHRTSLAFDPPHEAENRRTIR
jgi:hypothetical protein